MKRVPEKHMGIRERAEERRKRIVTNVAHSHEEAEDWDLWFWQQCTPQERLSALASIQRDIERIRDRRRG
jgi:hypothetical protein